MVLWFGNIVTVAVGIVLFLYFRFKCFYVRVCVCVLFFHHVVSLVNGNLLYIFFSFLYFLWCLKYTNTHTRYIAAYGILSINIIWIVDIYIKFLCISSRSQWSLTIVLSRLSLAELRSLLVCRFLFCVCYYSIVPFIYFIYDDF